MVEPWGAAAQNPELVNLCTLFCIPYMFIAMPVVILGQQQPRGHGSPHIPLLLHTLFAGADAACGAHCDLVGCV